MAQPVTKQIDQHSYLISMMGASQSLKMLTKLTKIVGEPLAMGMALMTKEGGDMTGKDQTQVLGGAVKALVERLDEDQVLKMIQDLVGTAQCDHKTIIFETHFQGRLGHLFKVLRAVLEVQYGDFLEEALSSVAGKMGAPATPAEPTAAIGESGA